MSSLPVGTQVRWVSRPRYDIKFGVVAGEVLAGLDAQHVLDGLVTSPVGRKPKLKSTNRVRHHRTLVRVEDRKHYPVYYAVNSNQLQVVPEKEKVQ